MYIEISLLVTRSVYCHIESVLVIISDNLKSSILLLTHYKFHFFNASILYHIVIASFHDGIVYTEVT